MLLLNTAMLNGHFSTESIMSFPKNDIRDLRGESVQEANNIVQQGNANISMDNSTRSANFSNSYIPFVNDMKTIYSYKGADVNIKYYANVTNYVNTTNTKIDFVTLNVSYYDGNTLYKENITLNY